MIQKYKTLSDKLADTEKQNEILIKNNSELKDSQNNFELQNGTDEIEFDIEYDFINSNEYGPENSYTAGESSPSQLPQLTASTAEPAGNFGMSC